MPMYLPPAPASDCSNLWIRTIPTMIVYEGQWGACSSAGFPSNRWANLTSIPSITGNLPLPLVAKTTAMSCLPSAVPSKGPPGPFLLWTCKIPLSIKPLMSLSLTPGSFFSLEAGHMQGLQACRVQPNTSGLVHTVLYSVFWEKEKKDFACYSEISLSPN